MEITIVPPVQCHLWQMPPDEFLRDLPAIKVYLDESHDIRKLRQCEVCAQLYFYEFHEEIDWVNGDDPQYRTLIPVQTEADADRLNQLNMFEILRYRPRLQSDWPSGQSKPSVFWIRGVAA